MERLRCLILLLCLTCCWSDVIDVKNVCRMKQDLDFKPIGYSCTFLGNNNVYVYQGSSIVTIDFDTFNLESTLIITGSVRRILIARGGMDLCNRIVFSNSAAGKVSIDGQNCKPAEKTVHTPKTTTVSLASKMTPTSSMMSVTQSTTSSVAAQTSPTVTAQTSSTVTAQASSTVTAPVKESDVNSTTTAWIISFVLSSVDVVKVLAGAFLVVVGVLLRFRRDLIELMNGDQLNAQQRQQINVPAPQNIPIPIPQRPQRIRNTPDRYGQWEM
ncbi:unnamed protein product [Mytilus coruscus]|uniref:Uncharacterized protein n=1 Tax=Mytilus coruscus TaxID=42192 RepID=A0A6J8E6R1_MYTCO|nr:unnamed protein product [Mytilus coruscus]